MKPRVPLAFLILSIALAAVSVLADEESSPREYTKVTKDGKYLFIMLAPKRWQEFGELHEKYPASGLYRSDGSLKPL